MSKEGQMGFLSNAWHFLIVLILLQIHRSPGRQADSNDLKYTNTWAVHIPNSDHERATRIAERHGMVNLGQVGSLADYYHFEHRSHPRRMRREIVERTTRLSRESEVKWVEQQVIRRRVKRDNSPLFSDPLWTKQWYLHNNDALFQHYDHNVIPVWKVLNITGRGVSVSILDDGIEKDHPDLKENYDPDASYDFNGNDKDPSPRPTYNDENRHGTRCGGEVAAVAGNGKCGVGVAYGAKVGGIRMLDGDVTDVVEAHSLSYKPEHIDIYSSSWGPDDDGRTVDGPGTLAKNAFEQGIAKGRRGLGNIFVWASGNGGREQDNCNCDGYTNSIFTLSISSASEHGDSPWYSEFCASTLASTFSSGGMGQRKIVTTDLHHRCTESHTGTSASAPLAAGILALALEANPQLTWRDMQHIVVRTSKPDKLQSHDWLVNGVGRKVSHRFGYGLLDAKDLVELALKWKEVPEKHDCAEAKDSHNKVIPTEGSLVLEKDTTACEGTPDHVRYLEHLEVVISLNVVRRGDLTIYVTSPQGTRSTLLGRRRLDNGRRFNDWVFMSTHTWEENPKGKWKLEITNVGSKSNTGTLQSWQIRFHGTEDAPALGYRNCSSECKNGCHGPSASDCAECANYKSNHVCVNKCSSTEYAESDTKKCLECHSSCRECFGPSDDQCKSCPPEHVLYGAKCVQCCPEGWFANNEKVCKKCDDKCLSCSGTSTYCTACREDHELLSNNCVINCKKNEYVQNDSCRPCHPSCATCSNGTAWSCTECGVATISREGVELTLYLHQGMCVATCPSGFYGDSHHCVSCHASCKHCKGPLNTQCTSCKDGLVKINNGTSECLDNCPAGFSHGVSEDTCVKCGSNCSACDPDHPSKCTACGQEQGLFLWKQKCVEVDMCPSNTYPEAKTQKCEYCDPSCGSCQEPPKNCTSCLGPLYLRGNTCISTCPTGTYGHHNKCLPCVANCSSCFGGGNNQCLGCHNGFYLSTTNCVKDCPRGMFVDKTTSRCEFCSMTCESCLGKATNCVKCKDGLKNVNGSCKSPCEDGTFLNSTVFSTNNFFTQNGSHSQCSKCHSSCITCTGPTKLDCLRCKGVKFHDPTTNLCSFNCPASGYYEDIQSTLCKPCRSECKSCSNATSCTSCINGLVLYNMKCRKDCPKGFYADRTTNTCMKCDSTCKECSGSPSSCISCNPPEIVLNGQCISQCPTGMFLSKTFNRCLPCDDSCLTCVGPGRTHCTTCQPSLVLYQAQCRSACPVRYYYNSDAKECHPCDYYCHKCNGGNGLSSCTECIPPFVLEKNMCVRRCTPGLVLDREKGQCVPCHHSCATCFGHTQNECLSCHDHKASLERSSCNLKCSVGKYRNPTGFYCQRCHPLCKTCTGSGHMACTECIDGLSHSSSKCVSQCDEPGKYRSHGHCYTCTTSCKTCKGPTVNDCLSCQANRRLHNFTCVKTCPPSTYQEDSNGLMECQECHPSCATCTGKTANECTSCRYDLYLEKTSCQKQCSINYQLNEHTKTCNPCNANCPKFANITDRSVLGPNDDQPEQSQSERQSRFVLIALASCTTLLAMFAVLGVLRTRSSRGYARVDNNNSSSNPEIQPQAFNNNTPSVYIRDDLEGAAMLDHQESEF